MGWCLHHSSGFFCLLQEVASSGSISPMLWLTVKVTPIDSWVPPLSQVSVSSWRCPHLPLLSVADFHSFSWPSSHLSCLSPCLILNLPISCLPLLPHSFLPLSLMTILLSLLSEMQASSLEPSFLFSFFGSVECIMGILYFMANIHLSMSICHACHFGYCLSCS